MEPLNNLPVVALTDVTWFAVAVFVCLAAILIVGAVSALK